VEDISEALRQAEQLLTRDDNGGHRAALAEILLRSAQDPLVTPAQRDSAAALAIALRLVG
jgi:hypothetical protein